MFGRSTGDVVGPAVAGTWYPADGQELERQVDDLFRQAAEAAGSSAPEPGITALIAPHAGFAYSGPVAARGFRLLDSTDVERVVLLGPSHYAAFDGAVLPDASIYRTPLGDVPIDIEAVSALCECDGFRVDGGPFAPEHCLEAEIPFLQRHLDVGWRLLPLLVGGLAGPGSGDRLAAGLRPFLGAGTLFVVSSDFTHYGPRFRYVPFSEKVPQRIEQLDMGAVEQILSCDAAGFEEYVERTGATICGRHPIGVLLRLMPERLAGRLAAYDTSGRITGEWDHSVSYASIAFRHAIS